MVIGILYSGKIFEGSDLSVIYLLFNQSASTTAMIGTARRPSIKIVTTTPIVTSLIHVLVEAVWLWGTGRC